MRFNSKETFFSPKSKQTMFSPTHKRNINNLQQYGSPNKVLLKNIKKSDNLPPPLFLRKKTSETNKKQSNLTGQNFENIKKNVNGQKKKYSSFKSQSEKSEIEKLSQESEKSSNNNRKYTQGIVTMDTEKCLKIQQLLKNKNIFQPSKESTLKQQSNFLTVGKWQSNKVSLKDSNSSVQNQTNRAKMNILSRSTNNLFSDTFKVPEFIREKSSRKKVQEIAKYQSPTKNIYENVPYKIEIKNPVKKWGIDDFEVFKKLGVGSFGEAFLVMEKKMGFLCVLKVIKRQIFLESKQEQQLIREIKIQSVMKHHHVTSLYGFFADQNYIYLVMELLTEENLYSHIKNQRLNIQVVKNIVYQLCQALVYLNSMNVIHRDLKPENVFVQWIPSKVDADVTPYVKLGDFGSAVHSQDQFRSTIVGSFLYLSPQQLAKSEYNQKIDSWQLGILAYQLSFGYCPYEEDIKSIVIKGKENTLSELKFPPNTNLQLKRFIKGLLEKDPIKRRNLRDVLFDNYFKDIKEQEQIQMQ